MTVISVHNLAPPRINARRFARNGQPVDPALIESVSNNLNNALRYRGKEIFRMHGAIAAASPAGTARVGNFLYRSTPYVRDVAVMFVVARRSSAGTVTVTLTNGAYTGTADITTSSIPPTTNAFDEISTTLKFIRDVPADVDVVGTIDAYLSRVISVTMWEIGPVPDTDNGYVFPTYSTNQNILDEDRAGLVTLANVMMRRGCAHVFNWCPDDSYVPVTTTSATYVNIIDGATTVSTSTAGYTLDMRNKHRYSETAVRCRFAYLGSVSAGSGGAVHLRDSTGAIVTSITGITTASSWRTVDFDLPYTRAKYDITHLTSAGTLSTRAISCFQLAT